MKTTLEEIIEHLKEAKKHVAFAEHKFRNHYGVQHREINDAIIALNEALEDLDTTLPN